MEEKIPETKPEEQIFMNNEKFEIPKEGMLGLLALGDVGLKMWRMKRKEISSESLVFSPESSVISPENLADKKESEQKTNNTGLTTNDSGLTTQD